MTANSKPLASPKDNLLGICNAVGEDFGFNPLWLRLALGFAFVLQPVGVVVAYLALGLVVLVSRLAFPTRVNRVRHEIVKSEAAAAPVADPREMEYAKAA